MRGNWKVVAVTARGMYPTGTSLTVPDAKAT